MLSELGMESREGRTGRGFCNGAEAGTGCRCRPVFGPLLEESSFVAGLADTLVGSCQPPLRRPLPRSQSCAEGAPAAIRRVVIAKSPLLAPPLYSLSPPSLDGNSLAS